ncbi:glutathione S-transferase [Mangrovicella endophytica]|uniref:glutathione S-transferase n=1 Tax=Mangrovicella endophytica TaxID=2066697 RepID=UPI000C9DB0C2|nr:glutathione S-transferase [Mangrovicella endophytica]
MRDGREDLAIEAAVNDACPWSGKPVSPDSLTRYKDVVVGFCNPGCRDKFETAVEHFEAAISRRTAHG